MKKTDDEIQAIVSRAVEDAVAFVESDIAPDRIKAQRYFNGETDIGHEPGRSRVVATKCRDVVRQVKPNLMRVFLQTDKPVEFVPTGEEDVSLAEQATEYINYEFQRQNGYRLLSDVFHDALVKKVGIAKVYADQSDAAEITEYSGLDDGEMAMLAASPDVEVLEHALEESGHRVKLSTKSTKTKMRIESLPPEEFFVDDNARSIDDNYICGHQTEMRVGDLVAMGFDMAEVKDLGGADQQTGVDEDLERRNRSTHDDEQVTDPAMMPVMVTEAYMQMDIEGTGALTLYKFILGGTAYELLDYSPVADNPFAIFEVDPEPHTFFGRSLVDIILYDQDAATAVLRGVLDNIALTNTPRVGVDDDNVDMDDVLNNEIGGIIRTRGAPADKIFPMVVPFTAGSTLPAVQYLDQVIEGKTGVSRAATGMDPDALQSTTAAGVNATVQAASAQSEVMARNLAEGGVKRLFKLMLGIIRTDPPKNAMMRLNGAYIPAQPDLWPADMDVSVNVGLGTGQDDIKMAALQMTLQQQMMIWQTYGPGNALVSLQMIRNTLADILVMSGMHNASRYYKPVGPEIEQQMVQQMQQNAANPQPDPADKLVQVEMIKAQAKQQTDMAKLQLDAHKMRADNDIERDQMILDGVMKAADLLGKYNIPVDLNAVRRMQAAN